MNRERKENKQCLNNVYIGLNMMGCACILIGDDTLIMLDVKLKSHKDIVISL